MGKCNQNTGRAVSSINLICPMVLQFSTLNVATPRGFHLPPLLSTDEQTVKLDELRLF